MKKGKIMAIAILLISVSLLGCTESPNNTGTKDTFIKTENGVTTIEGVEFKIDEEKYRDFLKSDFYCQDIYKRIGEMARRAIHNTCYGRVAAHDNDVSICDLVEDDFLMDADERYDYCLWDVAVRNGRPELCEKIKESDLRSTCNENM